MDIYRPHAKEQTENPKTCHQMGHDRANKRKSTTWNSKQNIVETEAKSVSVRPLDEVEKSQKTEKKHGELPCKSCDV